MSRLSLLKWVYDLGYKNAENKYYFAIMEEIRRQDDRIERLMEVDKPDKDQLQKQQALGYKLRDIIENIFHPYQEPEPYQPPKNRFLP